MKENTCYHIGMQVVTPLAVGAGNEREWTCGVDFVQKDGKVYIIDLQKAVAKGVDIDKLSKLFLKSDESGICQLLGNQIERVSSRVFDAPARSTNAIKAFQRTQLYDKPLVAGSSIKGAVRSILFNALRTDECSNEQVFGNLKDGTDFMRFIRVSDIEMPSTILVNTKLFNLREDGKSWAGGWKHGKNQTTASFRSTGFNTLYECIEPGRCGCGTIGFAGSQFGLMMQRHAAKVSHARQKQAVMEGGIPGLFQLVNSFTRTYLLKERDFFEKYKAERSEEVVDCIEHLLEMIPSDGSSCLMKMSAGVGFHVITGDWRYQEDYDQTGHWSSGKHEGKKKYKSRKIAEYDGSLQLMGFVKMRVLDVQEAESAAAQLQEGHQARLADIRESVRAEEERQRRENELMERQAQEREEVRVRRNAYQMLLEQARLSYGEGRWDDTIAKANEALALFPEESEPAQIIARSESAVKAKEYRSQEASMNAERFNRPLAEVLKGIVSIGNLLGSTAKWLKVEGHALGDSEWADLLAGVQALPAKELRNLRKKEKNCIKVLGEERTRWLFESIR